jgi:hypothetical protein
MLKLWDKYGLWIAFYILLVIQAGNVASSQIRPQEVFFSILFLPFNLVLSFATVCRFLTKRWKWFGIWGPLLSRWIARWVGYTLVGILVGGLVFSVFGLILAPVIAILITIFHIADDVQTVRFSSRP